MLTRRSPQAPLVLRRCLSAHPRFRFSPPTPQQIQQFNERGFLQVDSAFTGEFADRVASCIDDVFVGKQETGIYPDEWYWRPETFPP
jgi:hypothetical protein